MPLVDYVQCAGRGPRATAVQFQSGLSTRAAISLLRAAQAWAFLHDRPGVLPEDLQAVLPAVVGHRLRPREATDPARSQRAGARAARGRPHSLTRVPAPAWRGSMNLPETIRGTLSALDPARPGTRWRHPWSCIPAGSTSSHAPRARLRGDAVRDAARLAQLCEHARLALTFLLAALGLVAMHACHRNLAGLVVSGAGSESPFAGQDAVFRFGLANPAGRADRHRAGLAGWRPADRFRRGRWRYAPRDRGRLHAAVAGSASGAAKFATRYPRGPVPRLGGAASRRGLPRLPETAALAPAPPAAPGPEGLRGRAAGRGRLRRPEGLPPLATRRAPDRLEGPCARAANSLVKDVRRGRRGGADPRPSKATPPGSLEARLAVLARWVVDAHGRGEAYGLRLPGSRSRSGTGGDANAVAAWRHWQTSARRRRTLSEASSGMRRLAWTWRDWRRGRPPCRAPQALGHRARGRRGRLAGLAERGGWRLPGRLLRGVIALARPPASS